MSSINSMNNISPPGTPSIPSSISSVSSANTTNAVKKQPLVEVNNIARHFDVSPAWLERVIYRRPKLFVRAVDDVSFTHG